MKLFVGPWQRQKPAAISLDLRWREQVHGVAVDDQGRPIQWLSRDRHGDDLRPALDLVQQLDPGNAPVRVLLAEPTIQTTSLSSILEPDIGQIQDALLGDGHAPLEDPLTTSLPMGEDSWIASACEGRTVTPLLNGLASLGVSRIDLVADSVWIAQQLQEGDMIVEAVDDRLLLAARPSSSEAILRSLVGPSEPTFQDLLQEITALGPCHAAQVLGASRQSLAINLRAAGLTTTIEPLPWNDSGALAMPHEVAWSLATAPAPPALRSPRYERMAQQLVWSKRLRRGAVAGGLVGALLMVATLTAAWSSRERLQEHRLQQTELHREVAQIQDLASQVEEIQSLRGELQQQRVPWPPLAPLLAELSTALPDGAAFERLQIKEARLELDTWAPSSREDTLFKDLRHHLAALPQLSNLSWDPPAQGHSPSGSVQSLSAQIQSVTRTQEVGP